MEFDKSRVYTSLNADELKVGSKVIVASDLATLKCYVRDMANVTELQKVHREDCTGRFEADDIRYTLCYLISEPEEKKLIWSDLKIGDVIRRRGEIRMITGISTVSDSSEMHIFNGVNWLTDEELEEMERDEREKHDEKVRELEGMSSSERPNK